MSGSPVATRLKRLEQLKGLLRTHDHVVASELAAELGVSLRTINRDLAVLRESGVPIESDRGRGGGLRLQRNWALGRIHLTAAEAVDLLLSMAIAERMNSPLLLDHLRSVRRKIVASFSEAYQAKIRSLRNRILVGKPASQAVLASFAAPGPRRLPIVAEAFFEMKRLRIDYEDQLGTRTERIVEPHFLYLSPPVWYVLSWDRLREAVRYFRIDRIGRAEMQPTSFRPVDRRPFLAIVEEGISTL